MTLIEAIEIIEQRKRDNKQIPTHAMIYELMSELKLDAESIIAEANKQGLKVGRTINSKFIIK